MKNKRNALKIRALAMQLTCNPAFVLSAYRDATRPKLAVQGEKEGKEILGYEYGYICFDLRPEAPEILTFRTNLFPDEIEPITVYRESPC